MKKHTTYEKVAELLGVEAKSLYIYKFKKVKLPGIKNYVLDENATKKESIKAKWIPYF